MHMHMPCTTRLLGRRRSHAYAHALHDQAPRKEEVTCICTCPARPGSSEGGGHMHMHMPCTTRLLGRRSHRTHGTAAAARAHANGLTYPHLVEELDE